MAGDDSAKFAVPTLDGTNYATWSLRVKAYLTYKGLWATVANDPPEPHTDAFAAMDDKATAILTMAVADHLLPTVARCTTAKEAWTALESLHAPKSTVRKLQLRTAFAGLKQGTAESATAYVNRAKSLRDDLATAGHSTTTEDLATQVLAGLSPTYSVVKAIIENTTDAASLDVDDILPRLLPYESGAATDGRPRSSTDSAYLARPSKPAPRRDAYPAANRHSGLRPDGCYQRGSPSSSHSGTRHHRGRSLPRHGWRSKREQRDRAENRCFWCHSSPHWSSEKDRYMDGVRRHSGTATAPAPRRGTTRPSASQFSAIAFTAAATTKPKLSTALCAYLDDNLTKRHTCKPPIDLPHMPIAGQALPKPIVLV